jgi:hypothetical protein
VSLVILFQLLFHISFVSVWYHCSRQQSITVGDIIPRELERRE